MPSLSPAAKRLSWILQLAVAAILAQTLYFKFTAAPESVYIFTTLGVEPWGRIASALVELAAVVLLLTPWGAALGLEPAGRIGSGIAEAVAVVLLLVPATAAVGALLALGVISGALASHLTRLGIEVQGDGGLLFGLACVVFAGSAVVLWLRRSELPVLGPRLAASAAVRSGGGTR